MLCHIESHVSLMEGERKMYNILIHIPTYIIAVAPKIYTYIKVYIRSCKRKMWNRIKVLLLRQDDIRTSRGKPIASGDTGQRIAVHDHSYSRGASSPTHLRRRVTQVACRLDRTAQFHRGKTRDSKTCMPSPFFVSSCPATRNSCNSQTNVVCAT